MTRAEQGHWSGAAVRTMIRGAILRSLPWTGRARPSLCRIQRAVLFEPVRADLARAADDADAAAGHTGIRQALGKDQPLVAACDLQHPRGDRGTREDSGGIAADRGQAP